MNDTQNQAAGEVRAAGDGPAVFVTLRSQDAAALIDFLVSAFGFVQTARYTDGDRVAHAELRTADGRGGVMLGDDRDEPGDTFALHPGSAGAYVVVSDPDALYRRATAAGAEVVQSLENTDYGSRGFTVSDPEGNLWSFGTYAGEPLPD